MEDTYFMDEALALAREAAADGEVPVGCVIVRGDTIVGRGRNRREEEQSAPTCPDPCVVRPPTGRARASIGAVFGSIGKMLAASSAPGRRRA